MVKFAERKFFHILAAFIFSGCLSGYTCVCLSVPLVPPPPHFPEPSSLPSLESPPPSLWPSPLYGSRLSSISIPSSLPWMLLVAFPLSALCLVVFVGACSASSPSSPCHYSFHRPPSVVRLFGILFNSSTSSPSPLSSSSFTLTTSLSSFAVHSASTPLPLTVPGHPLHHLLRLAILLSVHPVSPSPSSSSPFTVLSWPPHHIQRYRHLLTVQSDIVASF